MARLSDSSLKLIRVREGRAERKTESLRQWFYLLKIKWTFCFEPQRFKIMNKVRRSVKSKNSFSILGP